jgi:SAM-dependent methyltransferase
MASPIFRNFRLAEIEDAIQRLRRHKPSGTLLEIGAGTGWQSKALAEAGYEVEAIDLPADVAISNHARTREWPIRDYDGANLPFGAEMFDIIYSSNVLEHVEDLDGLTVEMRRVLRRDGLALHLLPNPVWRLLSLLTYYPAQAIDAVRWLARKRTRPPAQTGVETRKIRSGLLGKAINRIIPAAHGARGTALGELHRFSKSSWDDYFDRNGWDVIEYAENGLLASGDYLLGRALPMRVRAVLGKALGGIAHVYLVKPRPLA